MRAVILTSTLLVNGNRKEKRLLIPEEQFDKYNISKRHMDDEQGMYHAYLIATDYICNKIVEGCEGLETFILDYTGTGDTMQQDGITKNAFKNCTNLSKVIVRSQRLWNIKSGAFYGCTNVKMYDFSTLDGVPTLENTDAFYGINPTCKIVVKDSKYSSWIYANNWSTYANYIYKASEVV